MRGILTLAALANWTGEPKYVSTSIGLRAVKSWYIVLGSGVGAVMLAIVFCAKSVEKVQ